MWQVRRCLNILQRASKEEIEDLFSTSSQVQKMNGIFAPKCHPELQGPIEMCWARAKYYCARHSNHTLA